MLELKALPPSTPPPLGTAPTPIATLLTTVQFRSVLLNAPAPLRAELFRRMQLFAMFERTPPPLFAELLEIRQLLAVPKAAPPPPPVAALLLLNMQLVKAQKAAPPPADCSLTWFPTNRQLSTVQPYAPP